MKGMMITPGLIRKLRSYFVPLPANLGVAVYRSTDQSHNKTGGWVFVSFDTQREDTGLTNDYPSGFWEGVTNPTRLTAVKAGWYIIWGGLSFAASAAGTIRAAGIRLNGTTFIDIDSDVNLAATAINMDVGGAPWWMNKGNYVELGGYQDTGGNLNMPSIAAYSLEFRMVRVP
jgi:hypothetical protein